MLIGDIVRLHAFNYPNKVMLVEGEDTRLTYKEFNERVNRLANALRGLGLTKGERIVIFSRNSHQFAESYFAVAKAGLVFVAANWRAAPMQILSLIRDAGAKAMLVQKELSETINCIRAELPSVQHFIGVGDGHSYSLDYESLLAEHSPDEPQVDLSEDDLFVLLYTSGTTGEPKGIPNTHRQLVLSAWQEAFSRVRYAPDDVVLLGLPFAAPAGQLQLIAASLAGITLVIHTFGGRSLAELVEKESVTVTYLGSTQYKIVRDYLNSCRRTYDFSSLRSLRVGTRPMPADQVKEMLDYFKIPYSHTHRNYGLSECVHCTWLDGNDIAQGLAPDASQKEKRRVDSVGKPYLVAIRIVDEEGNDVPAGEMGEIVINGEGVVSSYWNKPELTKERWKDGWFHTHDLGVFDEDGYLYFKGRKDFMIKSGMLFVAPLEVENAIMKHPSVDETAVIGVPDKKWGEAVKAIVRIKKGRHATEEEIKAHCRQHIAGYQVPKSVDFVEALPRDNQGKVDVKGLRKIYADRSEP
jgi:long-chain acyl-CoA synthetase